MVSHKKRSAPTFGARQTFDSSREAADEFYDENALYFDYIPDPGDGLREWADGQTLRAGHDRTSRLRLTAAGRKILEAPQGGPQIRAALQWIFGRAKGRRWDAVDWTAIDDLEAQLKPHYEPSAREASTGGIYWRPGIAGQRTAERLDDLDPHQLTELGAWESADELRQAVAELRETYVETSQCLTPLVRVRVASRIAEFGRWAEDPDEIPEYACEPDPESGGYVCNYPLVIGEVRQLRDACRGAYDVQWAAEDLGTEGFPDSDDELPGHAHSGAADADADAAAFWSPHDEVPSDACDPQRSELRQLQTDGRAYGAPLRDIADTRELRGVWYQQEWRTCGRSCVCVGTPPQKHGPYWYGYWRDGSGARKSKYIGIDFRPVD